MILEPLTFEQLRLIVVVYTSSLVPLVLIPYLYINNKTILVWGEQGIGDEIMFAHAIPDLLAEGAKLVLECSQRLVPVFLRSFEDATIVARAIPPDKQIEEAQIDCEIPIAALCSFYRNTKSSFDFCVKTHILCENAHFVLKRTFCAKTHIINI